MAPRKSHKKSRAGCLSCKRRRVKCDEKGPPCGPCIARQINCQFSADLNHSSTPVNKDGQRQGTKTHESSSSDLSNEPAYSLLELQLLHRWSSITFKTFCGTLESEYPTWQLTVPNEAFKHHFLLQGVFAASSLEMAATTNPPNYADLVNQALEHHSRALACFQSELTKPGTANSLAAFLFSVMTMVLSLALPQYTKFRAAPESMVNGMVAHFGLLQGVGLITLEGDILSHPIMQNHKPLTELPRAVLAPQYQSALQRLCDVNEERHSTNKDQDLQSKLSTITLHTACQKGIILLEEFWAKCEHNSNNHGHILAWLNFTGKDFVEAIQNADPTALLVLMYWGVLGKKCSEGIWWAQSIGEDLTDEITAMLADERDPALRECISWARKEVGLDP